MVVTAPLLSLSLSPHHRHSLLMPSLHIRSMEYRILHLLVVEQIQHRCPANHPVSSMILMGLLDPSNYGQRQVTVSSRPRQAVDYRLTISFLQCRGGCCSLLSPRLTILQRLMLKQKVAGIVNTIQFLKLVGNPVRTETAP